VCVCVCVCMCMCGSCFSASVEECTEREGYKKVGGGGLRERGGLLSKRGVKEGG